MSSPPSLPMDSIDRLQIGTAKVNNNNNNNSDYNNTASTRSASINSASDAISSPLLESSPLNKPSDQQDIVKQRCFPLSSYHSQWLAFCILGTINNLSYVMVLSAAQSLAKQFNSENLIGVIQWANVGVGIFIKMLNTWYLLHWDYRIRMLICTALSTAGLVALALSVWINFWFSIFGIALIGCFSSLGESVLLGYLKLFNPLLAGAWGNGTGWAGVGGTALYLLLHSVIGMNNQLIFLILLPTNLVYYYAFYYLYRRTNLQTHTRTGAEALSYQQDDPVTSDNSSNDVTNGNTLRITSYAHKNAVLERTDSFMSEDSDIAAELHSERNSINHDNNNGLQSQSIVIYRETRRQQSFRVMKRVLNYSLQLAAVYFFEYAASVGFGSKATDRAKANGSSDWAQDNAYELISFCYQFGVLISRSSISIIKIRRVWILTTLQGANFILWWLHAEYLFLPLWFQFIHMIFIGLLGGAMYINIFFLLNTETVSEGGVSIADRELAVNIVSLWVNFGIVASSVFEIAIFNTIMK